MSAERYLIKAMDYNNIVAFVLLYLPYFQTFKAALVSPRAVSQRSPPVDVEKGISRIEAVNETSAL